MKIYTKTGDGGATSLLGGRRVSKSDPAPEAYGTVDELNVELGVLLNSLDGPARERLTPELRRIQRRLFAAGSRLAASNAAEADTSGAAALNIRDYEWIEASIDEMDVLLKPLQSFILPGGCAAAVQAHRARAVCRRAERRVVALAEHLVDSTGCHHVKEEIRYLNRLADYFFVVARYCNHVAGAAEFEWRGERR